MSTNPHLSLAERSTQISKVQARRYERYRLHRQYLEHYMAEVDAAVRESENLDSDDNRNERNSTRSSALAIRTQKNASQTSTSKFNIKNKLNMIW